MKSIKQYSQTLLLLTLLLSGCGAYLDVNPKSEVTDKELFSTAEGWKTPSTESMPRSAASATDSTDKCSPTNIPS